MSYFLALLVTLRLVMWRVLPQYGTGAIADAVFGMLALMMYALYLTNKKATKFTPWIFLWVIGTTISVFYSSNFPVSFGRWFLLLINVSGFALAVQHLRNQNSVNTLWTIMVLGAVLAAVVGIWEFFLLRFFPLSVEDASYADVAIRFIYSSKRSCSFLGWPTSFAGYLILFIPSVWFASKHNCKIFWRVCFTILILGLVSSFSLAAALSLAAAIIISGSTKRLKWVLMGMGLVVLLIGHTKSLSAFFNARQEYYQAAWQMIVQHPFVGGGIGMFQSIGASKSTYVHNSYLQVWAETGPLGLIGVLGFVYAFWTMKPKTDIEKGMYVGLLAFFIENLFGFSLIKPNLSFSGWVALACYIVYRRIERRRKI